MMASMSTTAWNFDNSHSSVGFNVRHMMIAKVHGAFSSWSGTLLLDATDLTKSSVNVSVDVASINTKDEKRDGHLKSADFFDVANTPTMTFVSTKVESAGGDELAVHGDLTIRGITKPIILKVELGGEGKDPWGNTRRGFEGKATINRKDFGLSWNAALETGGVLVSEKVEIVVDVQAIKA